MFSWFKTEAEGYAPEEVEDRISRKIEEAIATTQGITKLESRSRAGNSEVLLSFNWGTDINDAIQDDPSIIKPLAENPVIPGGNLRPSYAKNPNPSIANPIIFEKKDSPEDDKEPLLNPIISSCSFRKLSPEMSSILKPLPPKSIQTKKQEIEAEAVV